MFNKTVHEEEFGPLSYQIKSPRRAQFTLWLGGCRIGKPRDNGDVWEFTAKSLDETKAEMLASAKRELGQRITNLENQLTTLREIFDEVRSV